MKRHLLVSLLIVICVMTGGSVSLSSGASAPAPDAVPAPPVEPLLLYKAEQDKNCHRWVDSVYNRMNLKERVGQLFIYTIAPVETKRNQLLLRDAVDTHKVGGLLFSGGKMDNQAKLTNTAQRMAKVP